MDGVNPVPAENLAEYKKRAGCNSEGFQYEIRICMLIILRCVKNKLKFELKCNEEDEVNKLFDDAVCKISKPGELDPHKNKHLYLQAKHYTRKGDTRNEASIFDVKMKGENGKVKVIKPKKGKFPDAAVCKWFAAYQALSNIHPSEHFELVFYTTIDIEEDLKKFFTCGTRGSTTGTEFANIILCDPENQENVYSIPVDVFNTHVPRKPDDDVERFCNSLKIVVLQPNQAILGKEIKTELPYDSDPERTLIYNEACSYMETWHNQRTKAVVITWDIYAKAENKTNPVIIKKLLPLDKDKRGFTFTDTAISELKNILERGDNLTTFSVDRFEIHTDIVKQYLREMKNKRKNVFLFTFPEIISLLGTAVENFKTFDNPTYVLITTDGQHIAGGNDNFAKDLEEITGEFLKISTLHAIFLSTAADLPTRLNPCHFVNFSNLTETTQTQILSYNVEFMGEICTLSELTMNSEILIGGKILADLRAGVTTKIGEALPQGNFNRTVYITRKITVHQKVKHEKEIYSAGGKDKYIIIENEGNTTQANLHQGQASSTRQRIRVCSKSEASEVFRAVCAEQPEKGVHLLERTKGHLLWVKSGNHEYASEKVDELIDEKTPSTCTEDELIEKHICNPLSSKVVLVSSNPGMGKSHLAHSLARKLIKRKVWPVLVNLNKHSELFEVLLNSNKRAESPLFFFENCIPEAQLQNFLTFLADPSRVVVLLDGFDEIAPKYTEVVLLLVKSLYKTNVKNIVVLTRPHLAPKIQAETFALLAQLHEFSKTDIESYLNKHYTYISEINKKEYHKSAFADQQEEENDRQKQFASALRDFIFSKSRSYWMEVTGVPLQTYMVAEVFRERCEKYVTNANSDAQESFFPSEKDTEMDLYGTIVKQKVTIILKEKYGGMPTHIVEGLIKPLQQIVSNDHTLCGLVLIFGETRACELSSVHLGQILESPDDTMRYGIVTSLSRGYIGFIHRSFAEYFCAVRIADILLSSTESTEVKHFIYNSVLVDDEYKLIRKFINIQFSKLNGSLCFGSSSPITTIFLERVSKPNESENNSDEEKDIDLLTFPKNFEFTGAKDSTGLLFEAAREGNAHITRKILELRQQNGGANVLQRLLAFSEDWDGRTSLHLAAEQGHTGTVCELLGAGADHSVTEKKYGRSPLHLAAEEGHTETVSELLGAGAVHSVTDRDGDSPLHLAAWGGHLSTARELLDRGSNINLKDTKQQTALHLGAHGGHDAVVELLLDTGAHPEVQNYAGETPLHRAARKGHTSTVRLLAGRGCQLSATDKEGATPSHCAAESGNVGTIRALVELGLEVCVRDKKGRTPLHCAAEMGKADAIRVLVEFGVGVCEMDNNMNTPLHTTASFSFTTCVDREAVVHVLVELGAEVNPRNQTGQTPLHLASESGNTETVRTLIEHGAEVNPRNQTGQTPLFLAAGSGNTGTVRALIMHGAVVGEKDNAGQTPLHFAVSKSETETVLTLIEHGAGVDARDNAGNTPLHFATAPVIWDRDNPATALVLLENKASVNPRNNAGQTPLHLAASRGDAETVGDLIEHGAEVEEMDDGGNTPLHLAAAPDVPSGSHARDDPDTARELLDHGAELNPRNQAGQTPLTVAREKGRTEIARFLEFRGATV